MAMRSVFGKLKALTPWMRRQIAGEPKKRDLMFPFTIKDMPGNKGPLIDPTKYNSVKEMNKALLALLDKQLKADEEAFERYLKSYRRNTYMMAAAGIGIPTGFVMWILAPPSDQH